MLRMPLSPGTAVIAAGVPPAGAPTCCGGPVSVNDFDCARVPSMPGIARRLADLLAQPSARRRQQRALLGEVERLLAVHACAEDGAEPVEHREVASSPPRDESSWPPRRHTTLTGVPFAAMPRAFASASLSGNSESCSPWVSRVGRVDPVEDRRPGSPAPSACASRRSECRSARRSGRRRTRPGRTVRTTPSPWARPAGRCGTSRSRRRGSPRTRCRTACPPTAS